jgi:hypothetical protein
VYVFVGCVYVDIFCAWFGELENYPIEMGLYDRIEERQAVKLLGLRGGVRSYGVLQFWDIRWCQGVVYKGIAYGIVVTL